ncbi:putative sodium-coupled neutral amino acid transporter 10 [Operophtera brumata]|uniref:Putative sodium-coupled neutral amino acid transporter 10 n=1 Tax=Operophtera brumata TaxID=104452 RepID=A0A0L7KRP5_OPEBR|nr:putative sodium-coupled neutral amino acid transporter 10 [Operophtera brumata]
MASDVIKLGFVMSLAFTRQYNKPFDPGEHIPLHHGGHRGRRLVRQPPDPGHRVGAGAVNIVAAALCVSLLIPDIKLVLGLVGSTIGVLVCVVFPTACFVNVTFKNTNERLLAKAVLVLGLIIMVLGTYANLEAATEHKLDKYDGRAITKERIDKIPNINELPKRDPAKLEAHKPSNTVVKDSEVQPPNPVPPESNSNEIKSPDSRNNMDKINNDKLTNDVLLPEKVKEDEAADKVSESHPKNLKSKLEEVKLANGDTDNKIREKSDVKVNEEIKNEKINLKQLQLIETMKQHGEEQKELMQEQKEIMAEIIKNKEEEKPKIVPSAAPKIEPSDVQKADKEQQLTDTLKQHGLEQKDIINEIIKTKNEFEQNKKVDSNEAKKIAVESIKQIASMAIKSIGSVTEKPLAIDVDKKAERLEQLTNDAVQQIAQKAVETIEAIKDIKENPDDISKKAAVNKANLKPDSKPLQVIEPDQNNDEANKPSPQIVVEYVNKKPNSDIKTNEEIAQPEIKNVENSQPNLNKHFHSPDEPKSYKEGEDAEVNENKLNQNIPIPLAMKGLEAAKKKLEVNPENKENIDASRNAVRQKREVVDCTKTTSLDPADWKICKSLLSRKFDKPNDILPKVDLNDALSIMPLHAMQHIGRSLKNYDDKEVERD